MNREWDIDELMSREDEFAEKFEIREIQPMYLSDEVEVSLIQWKNLSDVYFL